MITGNPSAPPLLMRINSQILCFSSKHDFVSFFVTDCTHDPEGWGWGFQGCPLYLKRQTLIAGAYQVENEKTI